MKSSVSDSIGATLVLKTLYLGLCGGVAARAVQGGSLHMQRLCDRGPQSGSTNADRGSHFDEVCIKRQRVEGGGENIWYMREEGKRKRRQGTEVQEGELSEFLQLGHK